MVDITEAPEAYIVVLNPSCLGSVHGDMVKTVVQSGKSIAYCGIDRDPWWNLDDLFYAGLLSAELKNLRRTIERSGSEEFSPGFCDNLSAAQRVLALSATRTLKDEIIRIASIFHKVDNGTIFFGYDCYVDGFGSPLRSGIFNATNAFADFEDRLNGYGLFSNLDDLRAYAMAYSERCEQAGVEVIEERRISKACFFQVWGGY